MSKQIEDDYLEYIKNVNLAYELVDNFKLEAANNLLALEKLYNNPATKCQIESQHITFKSLLCSEISRSYPQVMPILRIARWADKRKVNLAELRDIAIPKIEVVAKADVKLTTEVLADLKVLDYPILKDKYGVQGKG